jgi:carbon storage regulator CsrA
MLVLSRRVHQSLQFPALGISIEVLEAKGNSIRLGINAPPDVRVYREELLARDPSLHPVLEAPSRASGWNHETRGRLNAAVMGLYVVEKQLRAGLTADAQATPEEALRVLEALDQEMGTPRQVASAPPSRKRIQALLVEDNPNEEALLASYLRMSGFEVRSVHDGYEALEFLSSNDRPDFILLDMRLPRFDGPSTVAAIRRIPIYDGVKIFIVSGSPHEEVKSLPIDGWFQKPLNPARIAQAMSAAAGNN